MEKSELQSEIKYGSVWSSQAENLVTTKKCQVPRSGRIRGRTKEETHGKKNLYYKTIMELGVNVLNELCRVLNSKFNVGSEGI